MLTIVIIIAAITVIIAVTLGLVFGLRKSGKSCTVKVSLKNGKMPEYKDSCNSSLNSNNPPNPGDLACKLSEKDYSIMQNQISKGGNADLKFTGVCSKVPNNAPGAKPPGPPPPGPPPPCTNTISFSNKSLTSGPSPKIFLEAIKINDSCFSGGKMASDYNDSTKFCKPSMSGGVDGFIKNNLNTKGIFDASYNYNGTCHWYGGESGELFPPNTTMYSHCIGTPSPCPLMEENDKNMRICCSTGTGCQWRGRLPCTSENTCYTPWSQDGKTVLCNQVDIDCCGTNKGAATSNNFCNKQSTPGLNSNGMIPYETMNLCCVPKRDAPANTDCNIINCNNPDCRWNCSPPQPTASTHEWPKEYKYCTNV